MLLHDIIHTKETLTLVFEYVVSPYEPVISGRQSALNNRTRVTACVLVVLTLLSLAVSCFNPLLTGIRAVGILNGGLWVIGHLKNVLTA